MHDVASRAPRRALSLFWGRACRTQRAILTGKPPAMPWPLLLLVYLTLTWASIPPVSVFYYFSRFARWSLKMDRSPTPMFVNVGEDSKPWNGFDSLVKRYGKFGTNVIYIQKYLNTIGYKRKWGDPGDGMYA